METHHIVRRTGISLAGLMVIFMLIFLYQHPWVILLPVFIGIGVLTLPKAYREYMQRKRDDALARTNAAIALEVNNSKLSVIEHTEFLKLNMGEVAHIVQDAVGFSPKTKNEHNGFWGGISVPLPAHLHGSVGKFQSSPKEETHFESYGNGKLVLTNSRIVFIHEFGNVVIPLDNKVLNISAFNDGFRIDVSGKKPWMFVTGDIRFYAVYLKCQEELSRLEIMNLANYGRSNFKTG